MTTSLASLIPTMSCANPAVGLEAHLADARLWTGLDCTGEALWVLELPRITADPVVVHIYEPERNLVFRDNHLFLSADRRRFHQLRTTGLSESAASATVAAEQDVSLILVYCGADARLYYDRPDAPAKRSTIQIDLKREPVRDLYRGALFFFERGVL